jgi:hypothetical protein
MKTPSLSLKQLLVLVGVVVALVFGVTYAAMMIGKGGGGGSGNTPGNVVSQEEFLSFPFGMMMPADEGSPQAEREVQKAGSYDYWFTNPGNQPVRVGVEKKNCQCAKVELALLPREWWGKDLTKEGGKRGELLAGVADLSWEELLEEGKLVEVPPGAAGAIRVGWQAHPQPMFKEIKAAMVTESRGKTGAPVGLEAKINFVEPVRVLADTAKPGTERPQEAMLTEMDENAVETATFYCWSSTRNKFTVKIDKPSDPCLSCSEPEPLTEKERKQIGEAHQVHMLCGYRVKVTVREQTPDGKKHLDLGYFRRHITLRPEPDAEPVQAVVIGLVRGELEVGLGEEKNIIRLGSFAVASGTSKIITLSTEKNDTDLEVDEYTPFLAKPKLELIPQTGGGKTWELTVTVPPNARVEGQLRDCAVSLKIKGESGRRIRIPITGFAYESK